MRTLPQMVVIVVVAAVAVAFCLHASAQETTITLQPNGTLQWTNATTNTTFTLEWAPNPSGPWDQWEAHTQKPVTSATMSIQVPMCYRLATSTNVSKYVPPDGKVLMIVGQDTNNIAKYVVATGQEPGGVMLYISVANAEGLTTRFEDGGGPQFGQHSADTYSNSVLQIGLYMVGMLLNTVIGDYDSSIDAIGTFIQNADRPVYLRIGYEFDGDWTNYDPLLYQSAYRYIVDRFQVQGVVNVSYVWHSIAAPVRTNLMAWYPGDQYVDWVAASAFGSPSGSNRTNLVAVAELAQQLGKPFMLAETAPHGISTTNGVVSWAGWYDPVFEFIEDYDVKAFSYINCDWDAPEMWQFNTLGWRDSRVQTDTNTLTLWLHKMSLDKFMHASTNLFQDLGHP